jgi:porphobilinogen deaminase
VFVPAPGQGTIALQGRSGDERAAQAARSITDGPTLLSLLAERELARELGGDCHTPLGAWATTDGEGQLRLRAWVGLPDGSEWVRDELEAQEPLEAPEAHALAHAVARRLRAAGATELLERARELAGA